MSDGGAPAPVDLVIGLLSCNDAASVPATARAIQQGASALPGITWRIVWADCGSADDTRARIREAFPAETLVEVAVHANAADLLDVPYHGLPGKARALHGVLTAARALECRACVVVEAGPQAVATHWIGRLADPVLSHGVDFVSPCYERAAQEGALNKGIAYPFLRALYGARLRQPAAAELGCSPRLIDHLLEEDLWDVDGAQASIDLWLTASAASSSFRLGEAAMGSRPPQARGGEASDLTTLVRQVVGALFTDLEARVESWQRVRGSVPVETFGGTAETTLPGGGVDVERLIESFRFGYRELRDVWTWMLPPRTIVELRKLMDGPPSAFRLDDELWARIVYDFALGHRLRVLPRDHLLGSLVPLYLGWLASFVEQVADRGPDGVDERVDRLAGAFEAQKPYLIAKWRWPERVRS